MPKGPRGEKRPADVIGNALKVMRIATGEETEELETDRAKNAAAELGSRGGQGAGGEAFGRSEARHSKEGSQKTVG